MKQVTPISTRDYLKQKLSTRHLEPTDGYVDGLFSNAHGDSLPYTPTEVTRSDGIEVAVWSDTLSDWTPVEVRECRHGKDTRLFVKEYISIANSAVPNTPPLDTQ